MLVKELKQKTGEVRGAKKKEIKHSFNSETQAPEVDTRRLSWAGGGRDGVSSQVLQEQSKKVTSPEEINSDAGQVTDRNRRLGGEDNHVGNSPKENERGHLASFPPVKLGSEKRGPTGMFSDRTFQTAFDEHH